MAVSISMGYINTVLIVSLAICVLEIKGQACDHTCTTRNTCHFMKSNSSCFYLFPKVLGNWHENYDFCKSQQLIMAQPSKESLDYGFSIYELLQDLNYYRLEAGVWLGGRSMDLNEWNFVKGNGGRQFLTDINSEHKGNNTSDVCGFVNSDTLEFGAQDCLNDGFGICRNDTCEDATDCLRVVPEKTNWFEARTRCNEAGGDLFYLSDNERWVLDTLNETLRDRWSANRRVHVGLARRYWLWNDGSDIIYSNWNDSTPNKIEKTCLSMDGQTAKWQDEQCTTTKIAFCQSGYVTSSDDTELGKGYYLNIIMKVIGALLGISLCINAIFVFVLLCNHCRKRNAARRKFNNLEKMNKPSKNSQDSNQYMHPPAAPKELPKPSPSKTGKSESDQGTKKSNKKQPKTDKTPNQTDENASKSNVKPVPKSESNQGTTKSNKKQPKTDKTPNQTDENASKSNVKPVPKSESNQGTTKSNKKQPKTDKTPNQTDENASKSNVKPVPKSESNQGTTKSNKKQPKTDETPNQTGANASKSNAKPEKPDAKPSQTKTKNAHAPKEVKRPKHEPPAPPLEQPKHAEEPPRPPLEPPPPPPPPSPPPPPPLPVLGPYSYTPATNKRPKHEPPAPPLEQLKPAKEPPRPILEPLPQPPSPPPPPPLPILGPPYSYTPATNKPDIPESYLNPMQSNSPHQKVPPPPTAPLPPPPYMNTQHGNYYNVEPSGSQDFAESYLAPGKSSTEPSGYETYSEPLDDNNDIYYERLYEPLQRF